MRIRVLLFSLLVSVAACAPTPTTGDPATKDPCGTGQYWARYYPDVDQNRPAFLARCEFAVGGSFAGAPEPGHDGPFSVDAVGSIAFPVSGDYQLVSTAVGVTSTVWLDGEPVLEHADAHALGTDLVVRHVDAGVHTVRVLYSGADGHAVQEFSASQAARGPASANGNYFAANSFWNQPVPQNALVDARSKVWRDALLMRGHGIDVSQHTVVYHAAPGTPSSAVRIGNYRTSITVPYLPAYRPDQNLVIVDDASGCGYEFAAFHPETMSAEAQATYRVDTGSGGHVSGPDHSGGELSYLGGLITPQEVRSGLIEHALRLDVPISAPTYVFPGTRSDGRTDGGVPEGTRVQLDPALDLGKFHLSRFQTMVATALQRYGAFDSGDSPVAALSARSALDGARYPMPVEGLPKELLGHLRFLLPSVGSTDIQLDTAADTGCRQQA